MKNNYHCKICKDFPGFPDLSTLKIHQWGAHRSHYKNVGQNNARSTKGIEPSTKSLGELLSDDTSAKKCTMCSSVLKNEASFRTHMRAVHQIFKRDTRSVPAHINGNGHEPEPDKSLYAVQVEGLVEIAQMIKDLSEERKNK